MAEPSTKRKPSIDDQVAAIRQLIDAEANHLEHKVSRGLMREDTAQWRLEVLGAAYATMNCVRRYRAPFRTLIEAEQAFERERAAEIAAAQAEDNAGRDAA